MSSELKSVHTDGAPRAIGPYSQAVAAPPFLFVSGQIPLDPTTGEMVAADFAGSVRRVLDNLDAILEAAGSSRRQVVKVTVYLTDMGRFAALNEVYAEYFGDHRPARAVVAVAGLPRGAEVELEAVALL